MIKETSTNGNPNTVMGNHFGKNGYIMTQCSVQEQCKPIEKFSAYIAENYMELYDFFKALKKAMSAPNEDGKRVFNYQLSNDEKKNKLAREIASKFYSYGVFSEYQAGKKMLFGEITPLPRSMQFINDYWAEIYNWSVLCKVVKEYAESRNLPYHILSKVELVKNRDVFRVDYCFTVGDKLYMADVKFGNKNTDYYALHNKGVELGIVPDHYLVLNTALFDTDQADALEFFYEMYICSTLTYADKLREMISR